MPIAGGSQGKVTAAPRKRDVVLKLEEKLKRDKASLASKSFNEETKAVLIKGAMLAGGTDCPTRCPMLRIVM